MNKRGKVDPKILKLLNEYKNELIEKEEGILGSKNLTDKFDFYYLLKTQIRAVDSLIKRIGQPIPNDNPQIVDNVLTVFPQLELADIIIHDKNAECKANFDVVAKIQSEFIKYNLYPSPKEIIKETNKRELKKNFDLFVSNIGEENYGC